MRTLLLKLSASGILAEPDGFVWPLMDYSGRLMDKAFIWCCPCAVCLSASGFEHSIAKRILLDFYKVVYCTRFCYTGVLDRGFGFTSRKDFFSPGRGGLYVLST